jgi:hypothetical protein
MITRGFMDVEIDEKKDLWWFHKKISEMKSVVRPIENNIIKENTSIKDALETMKTKQTDCLLVFKDG